MYVIVLCAGPDGQPIKIYWDARGQLHMPIQLQGDVTGTGPAPVSTSTYPAVQYSTAGRYYNYCLLPSIYFTKNIFQKRVSFGFSMFFSTIMHNFFSNVISVENICI